MHATATQRIVFDYHLVIRAEDVERGKADLAAFGADVLAAIGQPADGAKVEEPAASEQRSPNGHARRASGRPGRKPAGLSKRAARDAQPRKAKTRLPEQRCPHCNLPFARPKNLAKHIAREHPEMTTESQAS